MLQVNALVHAVNSFPEKTPKRWSLISQLVSLVAQDDTAAAAYMELATNIQPTKGTLLSLSTLWLSRLNCTSIVVCGEAP